MSMPSTFLINSFSFFIAYYLSTDLRCFGRLTARNCFEKSTFFVRVCTEKMMDCQYRESGTRNIYQTIIREELMLNACSPNQ